jgi:hypothetical protein
MQIPEGQADLEPFCPGKKFPGLFLCILIYYLTLTVKLALCGRKWHNLPHGGNIMSLKLSDPASQMYRLVAESVVQSLLWELGDRIEAILREHLEMSMDDFEVVHQYWQVNPPQNHPFTESARVSLRSTGNKETHIELTFRKNTEEWRGWLTVGRVVQDEHVPELRYVVFDGDTALI